jgi:hypothetical protein
MHSLSTTQAELPLEFRDLRTQSSELPHTAQSRAFLPSDSEIAKPVLAHHASTSETVASLMRGHACDAIEQHRLWFSDFHKEPRHSKENEKLSQAGAVMTSVQPLFQERNNSGMSATIS